jgi:alpha-L-fucosidase
MAGCVPCPPEKLGREQADFKFGPHDFRFTVGRDGSLYAFTMTVPAPGGPLRITSLGSRENLLGKPITSVSLVGYEGAPLTWRQDADGLVIVTPAKMPFSTAVVFNIR